MYRIKSNKPLWDKSSPDSVALSGLLFLADRRSFVAAVDMLLQYQVYILGQGAVIVFRCLLELLQNIPVDRNADLFL